MITNLKMTSPMREKANHNQDVVSSPNKLVNGKFFIYVFDKKKFISFHFVFIGLTFHETSFADPKGVELDNAGCQYFLLKYLLDCRLSWAIWLAVVQSHPQIPPPNSPHLRYSLILPTNRLWCRKDIDKRCESL